MFGGDQIKLRNLDHLVENHVGIGRDLVPLDKWKVDYHLLEV